MSLFPKAPFDLSVLPIYVAQFPLAPFNGEESLGTSETRLTELAAFKIAAIERSGESVGLRVFSPRASSLKYQFIPSSAAILQRNFKTTKSSAGHSRDGIVQLYGSSLDCREPVSRELENRDAAAAKV